MKGRNLRVLLHSSIWALNSQWFKSYIVEQHTNALLGAFNKQCACLCVSALRLSKYW